MAKKKATRKKKPATKAVKRKKRPAESKDSSAAADEKRKLLGMMSKPLRELAAKFADRIAKGDSVIALTRWDCGRDIPLLTQDESKFGENAIPLLAKFLGLHKSQKQAENILYSWRNFALTFKRDEVKKLIERRGVGGKTISLNHFIHLSGVKDPKKRAKFTEMVFTDGLSVDQLAKELNSNNAKNRSSKGGRKPNPPRTPAVGLQQIYEMANQLQSRHVLWNDAVFGKIMDAPPTDLDTDLLNRATAAEDALVKLQKSIGEDLDEVRKCINRINKVVRGNGSRPASRKKKKSAKSSSSSPSATPRKKKRKRKRRSAAAA